MLASETGAFAGLSGTDARYILAELRLITSPYLVTPTILNKNSLPT
jgi:hypothetical protein